MPDRDPGINKPFDRILKAFADEAPRLFLSLLGLAPEDAEIEVQPVRPETAPPVVMPDYVAMVRRSGEGFTFHAEFEYKYHRGIPQDMARYGGSLALQYRQPVKSVLVLLRAESAPKMVPEVGHYVMDVTKVSHEYRVVRSWDLDPAPVLKRGDPKLLAWALLMRSSDEEVRRIASIVANQDDEEVLSRFLILGSFRYDRGTLNEMLGGHRMSGFIKAYMEGAVSIREMVDEARAEALAEGKAEGVAQGRTEGVAQGKAEGVAQGRTEGATEGERSALRISLRAKFPGLASLLEIDRISDVRVLEALLDQVMRSSDESAIRAAILTAAKQN